jgi:sRNA-binding protein
VWTMAYKFDRQELEDAIQVLAEKYPKCFFVNPRQRRPLKKNIVADLQRDGIAMAVDLISACVDWYKSHICYQYCLETGAKCLDLDGKEAGTVTELEHHAAQKKILEINERRAERAPLNSIRTTTNLVTARRVPEDQLKKIDAPMSRPTMLPELTPLYEAVLAANSAMSAPMGNSDVRAAVTAAAIGVVIAEAQRIVDNSKRDPAAQG